MAKTETGKLSLAEVSAIATAGHAVPLTLAGGGVIALLTGLSYAHLGLHFRGDGGSFTYIEKAFAAPAIAGCAGWLLILAMFAVAGFIGIKADHFVPLFNLGVASSLVAVALIFVAYEGFELIPNAIDEMADPARNLQRAIVISVVLTTFIYIVVAVAALGNLSPAQIQNDQEYVLAVAARPTLGQAGFTLIGIAALLSTASAINATLFGAARLAMVMAREHALPQVFALQERTRAVPYVALLALTVLSLAFALVAPLATISGFASATFLVIFAAVNFSALRLAGPIGLSPVIPLAGGILATASLGMLLWYDWKVDRPSLYLLLIVFGTVGVLEIILAVWRGRRSLVPSANS